MTRSRYGKLRYRPPGEWVQATPLLEVVGTSYREDDALAFLKAVRDADELSLPYTIALKREPENPHDSNAIQIFGVVPVKGLFGKIKAKYWHIGYVDRETAAEMHDEFYSKKIKLAAELYDVGRYAQYIEVRYFILAPPGNSWSLRSRKRMSGS